MKLLKETLDNVDIGKYFFPLDNISKPQATEIKLRQVQLYQAQSILNSKEKINKARRSLE